jgi:16S rRNA (adenine(1408)-N(1))-methyltransferase
VRILHGSKVVEAPASWRLQIEADGREVIVDLGAGDGRYVYESARRDPTRLYVGIDPDGDAMTEYAYRASRKPARGGIENARFVVAAVEGLPDELLGLAGLVRVNFPWGSLLRGLLEPDRQTLGHLRSLLGASGRFEIVLAYDPEHDTGAFGGGSLPSLSEQYIREVLGPAYESAGLPVNDYHRLTQDEALEIPSTWGRRLLHSRPRDVFFLSGVPAGQR